MADNEKPTIESVEAFVAEFPKLKVTEIIQDKFVGRVTHRTIQAAQRIAASRRTIKVPRNILRRLWRLTGGWEEGILTSAYGKMLEAESFSVLPIGDAEILWPYTNKNTSEACLVYRGIPVLHIFANRDHSWKDESRVKALVESLPLVSYNEKNT